MKNISASYIIVLASADPRVDPNYLLEYFSEVIKWYGYDT